VQKKHPSVEDAIADMSEPPPSLPRRVGRVSKKAVDFLFLYGLSGLCGYVVERKAEKALPFLLAVGQHLDMALRRGKKSVAVTKEVWWSAGDPPRNVRMTILAHVSRMPELIILREKRTYASRYRVEKGPLWLQLENDSREGRTPLWDDEDEEE
jgi:hypothetical protein